MSGRSVIPARPTAYKGIKMRSRLEADYASALDRDGRAWTYEPACFGGPEGQWLPDFKLADTGAYVEVKPEYLIENDSADILDVYNRVDKILRRMTVAWLSEPDAALSLVFWRYGADQAGAPLSIECQASYPGWLAYTPSAPELPMLWPGMGQIIAIGRDIASNRGDIFKPGGKK